MPLDQHLAGSDRTVTGHQTPPPAGHILNLPNILTLARFAAAPLAWWLLVQHLADAAFMLFVAASLTDALDGYLARRMGGNALGAIMDPMADKLLIVTMSVTLAATGALPTWLVMMVITRDVLIGVGYLVISSRHRFSVRPFLVSKVNTVLQMALVSGALLQQGFGVGLEPAMTALCWLTAATTVVSGAAYLRNAMMRDWSSSGTG